MTKSIILGSGFNATPYLMRDGLESLRFESQNDFGEQSVGSLTLTLSNMSGALDRYMAEDRVRVRLFLNGSCKFSGYVDPEGFEFDKHNKTVHLEALSDDAHLVQRMKASTFAEMGNTGPDSRFVFFRQHSLDFGLRYCISLAQMISQICGMFSVPSNIQVPANILVGGMLDDSPRRGIKASLNIYDVLTDVCNLFNLVWTVTGDPPTFFIRPKKSFLVSNAAVTPISLPLIKDSLKTYSRRQGWDSIVLKYPNLPQDAQANDLRYAKIERNPIMMTTREIALKALRYPAAETTIQSGLAFMTAEDDGGDYIWESRNGSVQAYDQAGLDCISMLYSNYAFELKVMSEQKASYSLVKDEQTALDAMPMFYTHWQTIYQNPWPFFHKHFVRSAEVDVMNKVLHVSTIGYQDLGL